MVTTSHSEPLRVLSLGAGVQSTTLYLMSVMGELPRLDYAIFADTGSEPQAVYDNLAWLESTFGATIPILRVQAGDLRAETLAAIAAAEQAAGAAWRNAPPRASLAGRFATLPLYVKTRNAKALKWWGDDSEVIVLSDDVAMLRRQCTAEYKIEPIRAKLRELTGRGPRTRKGRLVELWIGVSADEAHRQADSGVSWVTHHHPLCRRRLTRQDCVRWLVEHGFPVPVKSSCIFCPFHEDSYWREMKANRPGEWAVAVAFDAAIRRLPRIRGETFLHRAGRPLDEIDFSTLEERSGQQTLPGLLPAVEMGAVGCGAFCNA